ncbi:MAG: DUF4340 domain-containing protein [Microcoleaceae cyanobacterium]
MKLQRSTLILLLVALGLAGTVYIFEIRESEKQEQIAIQKEQIFTFSADDIQSLTVTVPSQTITIERIEENNTRAASPWRLTSPLQTLANPASVNELITQLIKSQTDPTTNTGIRQLNISGSELSDYGLDNSEKTVEVKLKNNQTYRLSFGKLDFNQRSVYAQIDPKIDTESTSILVIPKEILTTIEKPLEDWKFAELEPDPQE